MNRDSRRQIQNSRSRAISEGVNNAGLMIANLVSRMTTQLTRRRNRDHLVVPVNESLRRNKRSFSISPLDVSQIDTALGLKKRKSTFRKSTFRKSTFKKSTFKKSGAKK
jgi:hypothetical protein